MTIGFGARTLCGTWIDERRGKRVLNVLAVMRRRQAELLILRSDGITYEEAAHLLGLNPASIGTLLRRAQQAFRKEYIRRYGQEL